MDTFISDILADFSAITFSEPSTGCILAFCISAVLLLCSGFVSASEIAFFSLSPADVSELEEMKHKADAKVIALREESERLLATILICNNLVNVAIVMLLNYAILQVVSFGNSIWMEFVMLTVLLTFLLLLFGEIIPKIYSKQNTLSFCRTASGALTVLNRFWHPLSSILIRSKVHATRIIHTEQQSLTVDDLERAMELTDKKDIAQESSMLQGIIRFGGEMAREVMTSRVDIVDLEMSTPYPDVLKCIVENNYSRIPVYQGSEDNIKGVLYIKDLLPHLGKPANFRWQSLIRPPYFVPETKMIDDLLRDFQTNKVHIAIVVDEFGGTSGIVTMEDIIEEIVGEIHDEYDDDEKPFTRLNQNTYLFEAKTQMVDFVRYMKIDEDYFQEVQGDADTLAGLLLELKGDFPVLHERLTYKRFSFEVVEMDERRIHRIKIIVR